MEFAELVREHAEKVERDKDVVKDNEGATIKALIDPFFQNVLGYDTTKPTEYFPEAFSGVNETKTGEIDIIIYSNGAPAIIVEAKRAGVNNLDNQKLYDQLCGYYQKSRKDQRSAKFAILTNGVKYYFYTDIDRVNIMDDKPFLRIDFNKELKQEQVDFLKRFQKNDFDADEIRLVAAKMKTMDAIRVAVKRELSNPSKEFVKLLTTGIYKNKSPMSQKAIDRYRDYIKTAIREYADENSETEVCLPKQIQQPEFDAPKSTWNSASFLEQASSIGGADNAKICEKLINSFISMGCEIKWGSGKKYGSVTPVSTETKRYLCCLYNGDIRTVVQIFFGSKKSPMNSAEYRRNFKSMLERINGVRIKDKDLDKTYSFDVKLLTNDIALEIFTDTMTKYIEDIKAAEANL